MHRLGLQRPGAGTLTAVSHSRTSPTSVTVAGISHPIGTSAAYKLSSKGMFLEGASLTLLLGMEGKVVDMLSAQDSQGQYYGVILSSQQQAAVQTQGQVACSDGVARTFYQEGTKSFSAGRLVSVSTGQSGTTVKSFSEKGLEGTFNSGETRFADHSLSETMEILDTDGEGAYRKVYPARLAGATLKSGDERYYTLDENGVIDRLILRKATGDTLDYVYGTSASSAAEGMTLFGFYTYLQNGESWSISGKYRLQHYSGRSGSHLRQRSPERSSNP